MNAEATTNEAEILSRVIAPEEPNIKLLKLPESFSRPISQRRRERMDLLAEKARAGVLTEEEQSEIDCYERVGHFLCLLLIKGANVPQTTKPQYLSNE